MSREDIIKKEALNVLHIALQSEDDYEGVYKIVKRLNILIDTLQLKDKPPTKIYTSLPNEDEGDDDDNNSDTGVEEDAEANTNVSVEFLSEDVSNAMLMGDGSSVEYTVKINDDEVVIYPE